MPNLGFRIPKLVPTSHFFEPFIKKVSGMLLEHPETVITVPAAKQIDDCLSEVREENFGADDRQINMRQRTHAPGLCFDNEQPRKLNEENRFWPVLLHRSHRLCVR